MNRSDGDIFTHLLLQEREKVGEVKKIICLKLELLGQDI
jgi:hypothetical protein